MAQNAVNKVRVLAFRKSTKSSSPVSLEERCFCCLTNNIPMVQLATCKHNEFLQNFIKKDFSVLVVCRMCHIMLVKIYYFSQQVSESSRIFYGKSTALQISKNVYNLNISHKVVTTTNVSEPIIPKLDKLTKKVDENQKNKEIGIKNTIEDTNKIVKETVAIKEEKENETAEENNIDMFKEHVVIKNEPNFEMEVERIIQKSIDNKHKTKIETVENINIDMLKKSLGITEEVDLNINEVCLDIKEEIQDITEKENVDLVEKTSEAKIEVSSDRDSIRSSEVKIEVISDSDSSCLENSDSRTDSIENLTDLETENEVKVLDYDHDTFLTMEKCGNSNVKQMVIKKITHPLRNYQLPKKYVQLPQNNELQSKNNKLEQKNKQLPTKNKLAQKNNPISQINNQMLQETNQLPKKKRKRRKHKQIATLPKKKPRKQITQTVEDVEKQHKDKFKVIMLTKEQIVEEREQKFNNKYFQMHDFKCESCIIAFRNEILLQDHNKKLHMTGTEQCVICKMKMDSASYAYHLLVSHVRRYECVICGERSSTINKIAQHFNDIHSDTHGTIDLTIKCKLCEFTTESQSRFLTHIKEHKNEGNFSCAICNKNMSTQNLLSRHMLRAHNITMPLIFTCELCKEIYRTKALLFQHMSLIHPDKKSPLNYCGACSTHFGEADSLTHHYETHPHHNIEEKNRFKCKECALKFSDESQLKSHININHPKADEYRCTTCSDTSETLKDLYPTQVSTKPYKGLHSHATYASYNLKDHNYAEKS